MIAIPIITGAIGVGQTYLSNLVGLQVMQDLRNSLYRHLQFMPLRFFTDDPDRRDPVAAGERRRAACSRS